MKHLFLFLSTSLVISSAAIMLTACEKEDQSENSQRREQSYTYPDDISSGLVLHLTFDEGNCSDKSGNGHHGVAQGEVTYISDTPTCTGKALKLDGTQKQYVNIPYQLLGNHQAFTVSAWVKDFGLGTLLSMQDDGLNTPTLYVTDEGKLGVYFYEYYNSRTFTTSLLAYQASGWHHIVVTAQDQQNVTLYIDGAKMDSQSVSDVRCAGTKMQIGGNADGRLNAWADPMTIDNVRLYSRSLSGQEVSALYKAEGGVSGTPNKAPTTRGLLGYYTFDDNTADNTYLIGNNGILMGEEKPAFISDTPNGRGKALQVLSEQYVNLPDNVLNGKKAYSIGLWVKNFGTGPLFSTISDGFETPTLYVTEDSKLNVYYYEYYTWAALSTSLTNYQSSGWHHLVVTALDHQEVVLYIDGTKMDNKSISDVRCSGTKMQIGGNADGRLDAWADPMKIDNLRIHSVALSPAEVKAIYDQEKK